MTLRDLTPGQIKKLQKQCEKEREVWMKVQIKYSSVTVATAVWERAWSNGLKAGLSFARCEFEVMERDNIA